MIKSAARTASPDCSELQAVMQLAAPQPTGLPTARGGCGVIADDGGQVCPSRAQDVREAALAADLIPAYRSLSERKLE